MGKVLALLALLPLAACGGPDLGSMTKREAIATCHKAIAAHVDAGWRADSASASKDDRYWDVQGTSSRGFYQCDVNAVNGKVLTMYLPMEK